MSTKATGRCSHFASEPSAKLTRAICKLGSIPRFNGELVLDASVIAELGLPISATIVATLADGSEAVLETFACQLDWFGEIRHVEVIANAGYYPLLGIGLLLNRKLTIDYTAKTVTLA